MRFQEHRAREPFCGEPMSHRILIGIRRIYTVILRIEPVVVLKE